MIYDHGRGACGPYGVDRNQECGADKFIGVVLRDEAAASYVDGVAMHWYDDGVSMPQCWIRFMTLTPKNGLCTVFLYKSAHSK
jgi:hypothetical protein